MNANESESFGESQPYFRVTVALPSGLGWIVCVPLGAFYRHTYIYIHTHEWPSIYIRTYVHIYSIRCAHRCIYIWPREGKREGGGRGGSGFGGFELCARARVHACVRMYGLPRGGGRVCVTADTQAHAHTLVSTHGRENPAGAYTAGFCMRGGEGRGGSVVSSLLLFGTRYADLT